MMEASFLMTIAFCIMPVIKLVPTAIMHSMKPNKETAGKKGSTRVLIPVTIMNSPNHLELTAINPMTKTDLNPPRTVHC